MNTGLQSWRDEWELALSSGSVAPGTRRQYLMCLDQLLTWLTEHHPEADIEDLAPRHANGWLAHLTNRGLAASTRRLRIISVKTWTRYVAKQPDKPANFNGDPFAGIPLPEPEDKPVPVFDDEALTKLLASCKGNRFIDLRDTFIIRFLLDTGCRRGELVALNVDDVDRRRQEATVTGKTGTRTVPFSNKTAIALGKYLRARDRHPAAASPALILSSRLKAGWRYSGEGIRDMIDRRAKAAGLGHAWPHMLRHTWAHDMKSLGVSNEDLEHLGGWSPNSPTLRVYGRSAAAARARETAQRLSRGDRV